jgi:stearoyl-CoA desaturase (delta-9 desaturase)
MSIRDWLASGAFILLHLTPLALLYTGTTATDLVLFAASYLAQMFGITAGYDRYFAHRSFKTSRWVGFALAGLGCTALQRGPLWWVGHHRHTDTPADPHSPVAGTRWWAHAGWALSADHNGTDWGVVKDLNRHRELRLLERIHWLPAGLLAGLCLAVGGWSGLVWGFLIATLCTHHATFLVNSACHIWGRRRYSTPDASRNNAVVAVLTLGEGWHNNHHHYQSSARQGFRWWEVDITYYLIRGLGWAGLVWDIRQPPATAVARPTSPRGRVDRTPARMSHASVPFAHPGAAGS